LAQPAGRKILPATLCFILLPVRDLASARPGPASDPRAWMRERRGAGECGGGNAMAPARPETAARAFPTGGTPNTDALQKSHGAVHPKCPLARCNER